MPSTSRKQQKFMFSELTRKKKGQKTKTKMSLKQLQEFSHLAKK